MTTQQKEIDEKNSAFWNELCGTQLAHQLGVVDSSQESLKKFDDFYIDYYPYLKSYLFLDEMKGKKVLEVGLGYGTVSQLLAMSGADYHGLDIAENAVKMAEHRLGQCGKVGDVRVGSMLECPFPDNYFDYVISIGCLHHTGNLQKCIEQVHRILKKGGKATIMIYNRFSLRQWAQWPGVTAKNLLLQVINRSNHKSTDKQRMAYDSSSENQGAPETEFFSVKDVHHIFSQFKKINVVRENFDENFKISIGNKWTIRQFGNREEILNSKLVRKFGLDLYITLEK